MNRLALCLLLLALSPVASARDVRMHGPNGDGGACNDPPATPVIAPAPAKHLPVALHGKVKTPPLFRGGDDDSSAHAPRWHSFLPGMFR
jgi:hypothetical protein